MDIKICDNIVVLRKNNKMTQAQVAEYLGVSPQAVSKWEVGDTMPDLTLVPKIAFLFNVTIDRLFGSNDGKLVESLVRKYSVKRNDYNYKEAKEALSQSLDNNDKDLDVLGLLCHLEYQRALEYVHKCKKICTQLKSQSKKEVNTEWLERAEMQNIRVEIMLGNNEVFQQYIGKFEAESTSSNFKLALLVLLEQNRLDAFQQLFDTHINLYEESEQIELYALLMEVALIKKDESVAQKSFQVITKCNDIHQVFNAWWIMWKLYVALENDEKSNYYRVELKKQLEAMEIDDYQKESLLNHLNDCGDQPVHMI